MYILKKYKNNHKKRHYSYGNKKERNNKTNDLYPLCDLLNKVFK